MLLDLKGGVNGQTDITRVLQPMIPLGFFNLKKIREL